MSKIIRVLVVLVIIYLIQTFFSNLIISGALSLVSFLLFVYLIYLIVIYVKQGAGTKKKDVIPKKEALPNENVDRNKLWIFGSLAILLIVFFLREFLGRISFDCFLFIDSLLKLSTSISPVLMWGILGLFIGLIYGSFVAWKKYKLSFKLNLIPVGVLLLVVIFLIMVNNPFESIAKRNFQYGNQLSNNIAYDSLKKYIANKWEIVDVIGKDRSTFLQNKSNKVANLYFEKDGKGYMYENGIKKSSFDYTISPDGNSLNFKDTEKNENLSLHIISITETELVISSEIYNGDTVILKAPELSIRSVQTKKKSRK